MRSLWSLGMLPPNIGDEGRIRPSIKGDIRGGFVQPELLWR